MSPLTHTCVTRLLFLNETAGNLSLNISIFSYTISNRIWLVHLMFSKWGGGWGGGCAAAEITICNEHMFSRRLIP